MVEINGIVRKKKTGHLIVQFPFTYSFDGLIEPFEAIASNGSIRPSKPISVGYIGPFQDIGRESARDS